MFTIKRVWSEEDRAVIENFLVRAKALLATKEFEIEPTEKNRIFKNKYPLKSDEQANLLKSLQVEDCVDFGPNDNSRFSESTVFTFIKTVELSNFGEPEMVCLYIKEYIMEQGRYEIVCVISLHEEGMHEI